MNKVEQLEQTIVDLKATRDLLSRTNGWTRGTEARNNKGEDVNVNDKQACRFCTVGGISKISSNGSARYTNMLNYVGTVMCDKSGNKNIIGCNDDERTRQKDVVTAFDFAILMAEDDLKAARKAAKQ